METFYYGDFVIALHNLCAHFQVGYPEFEFTDLGNDFYSCKIKIGKNFSYEMKGKTKGKKKLKHEICEEVFKKIIEKQIIL